MDEPGLKMATADLGRVIDYLRQHREVTQRADHRRRPDDHGRTVLRRYIEPLLEPGLEHIESVRIGSKSLAYWPQRFVSDPDADDTLRLFEQVVDSGRSLAFMAHFSHPRELESGLVAEASRRIRATGAVIRTQAPLIRTINDDPATWATMWRTQVRMGMVPYYMFVERDTGPQDYFACRSRPPTASSATPIVRWPACAAPSAGRRCRQLPARCAWTGSPTWRASGSSSCT